MQPLEVEMAEINLPFYLINRELFLTSDPIQDPIL